MFGYQIYLIIILFGHFTVNLLHSSPQATTPSIYLYTHVVLALAVGFQTFSPSPTYIPGGGYRVRFLWMSDGSPFSCHYFFIFLFMNLNTVQLKNLCFEFAGLPECELNR